MKASCAPIFRPRSTSKAISNYYLQPSLVLPSSLLPGVWILEQALGDWKIPFRTTSAGRFTFHTFLLHFGAAIETATHGWQSMENPTDTWKAMSLMMDTG